MEAGNAQGRHQFIDTASFDSDENVGVSCIAGVLPRSHSEPADHRFGRIDFGKGLPARLQGCQDALTRHGSDPSDCGPSAFESLLRSTRRFVVRAIPAWHGGRNARRRNAGGNLRTADGHPRPPSVPTDPPVLPVKDGQCSVEPDREVESTAMMSCWNHTTVYGRIAPAGTRPPSKRPDNTSHVLLTG